MKGSALLAVLIVAALLLAAALLATLFVLLVLLVRLAGLAALLTGILVLILIGHVFSPEACPSEVEALRAFTDGVNQALFFDDRP
ncbi:hypothetical protein ACFSUK_31520 [Sphingobium scionense]